MGSEQDAGGDKNLDVIRQLLQKLEDAARTDVERGSGSAAHPVAQPAAVPETSVLRPVDAPTREAPARELASLQRSSTLKLVPPEPPASPMVRQSDIEPPDPPPRPRPFVLLPMLAFLLGVGSAIVAVMSIEDLRRLVMPGAPATVASRAAGSGPSSPVPAAPEATRTALAPAPAEPPPRASSSAGRPPSAAMITAEAPAATEAASVEPGSLAAPVLLNRFHLGLPERIAVTAGERTVIPFRIIPPAVEADGLLIVLRGMPDKITLSKGSNLGNEIWLVPAHGADDLTMTVAEPQIRSIRIEAELVALDGRVISRATTLIDVSASAVAETTPENLKLDEGAMIRLGSMLLDTGDIAGARAVMERAAERGSSLAALRLAETFDPTTLSSAGLLPSAGDPDQARRWYERARDLGNPLATERLEGLAK